MRIKLNNPYLSIKALDPIDLPPLTVLTGVNGSGKSHLLQAINSRHVLIEDIENPHIVLFTYESFKLDNQDKIAPFQMSSERNSAWQFFSEGNNQVRILQHLQQHSNIILEFSDKFEALSEQLEKPIWKLNVSDGLTTQEFGTLNEYKKQVSAPFINNNQWKSHGHTTSIYWMLKKSRRLGHNITAQEFYQFYDPYALKENFLPNQLSRTFANYFSKLEENYYNEFLNSRDGGSRKTLSNEEFEKLHGPKPWEAINSLLSKLSSMPYQINSPEGTARDTPFHAQLSDISRPGVNPTFDHLSSGEQVLMALVASAYKSDSDKHFPDVLLLDEIDASLHPSMMQSLLTVVEDVFISHGVQCVIVTHSPTTIALAPDDSVFVMKKDGSDRLRKCSRSEALEILTEGFATIDEGLKLLDQAARNSISVITEGRNSKLIKAALEKFDLNGVTVVEGIEGMSGKNQLHTLFQFFSSVDHSNEVVFVWDCDASNFASLDAKNRTHPFAFDRNDENSFAQSGIENLFDEKWFEGLLTEVKRSDGSVSRNFEKNRKVEFEARVLAGATRDDFKRFGPLVDKLAKLGAKTGS